MSQGKNVPSSSDVSSFSGSFESFEDRLDSDIEADILNVNLESHSSFNNSVLSLSSVCSSKSSNKHPVFIKRALLSGVSSQLSNVSSKLNLGSPSCISLRRYVVIGTTNGVIYVYSLHQILRFCFGNISSPKTPEAKAGESQGPITAICQNINSTKLISGYASGRIAVWYLPVHSSQNLSHDTISGRLDFHDNEGTNSDATESDNIPRGHAPNITTNNRRKHYDHLLYIIDDAHGLNHAISFCAFTTLPSLSVCLDTGGSVFQLKLTKRVFSSKGESSCFFSGCRGEICTIQPLELNPLKSSKHVSSTSDSVNNICQPSKSCLGSFALVAMATLTKLIIVQLRPHIQVLYWQPFKGPPSTLPLLTWRWCPKSLNEACLVFGRGTTIHVLQITQSTCTNSSITGPSDKRNSLTDAFQMIDSNFINSTHAVSLNFQIIHTISMNADIINIKWISFNHLITLDRCEQLHLVNSMTGEDLEAIDLTDAQINCNCNLSNYSKIGTGVSEALALASENFCFHSVTSYGSQLLMLGQSAVHLITLRTWCESVTYLMRRKQVELALNYCKAALQTHSKLPKLSSDKFNYELNTVLPTDCSLPLLLDHIAYILQTELPVLLLNAREKTGDDSDDWTPTYAVISSAVQLACGIGKFEIITDKLYPIIDGDSEVIPWLFISIYNLIKSLPHCGQYHSDKISVNCHQHQQQSDDSLKSLCYQLTPDLTKQMFGWCVDSCTRINIETCSDFIDDNHGVGVGDDAMKDISKWVETCLLILHPSSFDFNYAIKLCWSRGYFGAYLHLHTDILMDFETPFNELVKALHDGVHYLKSKELSDEHNKSRILECGHCLLMLIRIALAGESYSHEPLPSPLDENIPTLISNLLLSKSTSLFKQNVNYPILQLLLEYSVVDFLNLLTITLADDKFFANEIGLSRRQCLFDCLMQCDRCYNLDLDKLNDRTTPSRVLIFLSNEIAKPQNVKVMIENSKICELFTIACASYIRLPRQISAQFESATIDLFSMGRLTQTDRCLDLASVNGLHKLCEYIHTNNGEYLLAFKDQLCGLRRLVFQNSSTTIRRDIRSDMEAVQLAMRIFQFLRKHQSAQQYVSTADDNTTTTTIEQTNFIKSVCLAEADVLAGWDAESTLRILYDFVEVPILPLMDLIVSEIKNKPRQEFACFSIMRAYFKLRRALIKQSKHDNVDDCIDDAAFDDSYSQWHQFILEPNPEIAEFYIKLLIQRNFVSAENLLMSFLESDINSYRAEQVLNMVSVDTFPHEIAYLYEKLNRFDEAMDLYEKTFSKSWSKLIELISNQSVVPTSSILTKSQCLCDSLQTAGVRLLNFCQRRCEQTTDESFIQSVWFHVIDLLKECEFPTDHYSFKTQLNDIFHNFFSLIISYVSPTKIAYHILHSCPNEISSKLGPKVDSLIERLISTCQFETDQMIVNQCLSDVELSRLQFRILMQYKHGFGFQNTIYCASCRRQISPTFIKLQYGAGYKKSIIDKTNSPMKFVAFRCKHIFHLHCIPQLSNASCLRVPQIYPGLCTVCDPGPINPGKVFKDSDKLNCDIPVKLAEANIFEMDHSNLLF